MSGSKSIVTVDCETDWGGRTENWFGITMGLPYILAKLKECKVKAIFFINTSCINEATLPYLKRIQKEGYEIGSHGHWHKRWREKDHVEWARDWMKSVRILKEQGFIPDCNGLKYRAPHFSKRLKGHIWSIPKNHISLLKYSWGLTRIPRQPIYYLHPFDITEPISKAPNLFCKILYSRNKKIKENFDELLRRGRMG